MRAFVAPGNYRVRYTELAEKLQDTESRYNKQLKDVYEVPDYLMGQRKKQVDFEQREPIGFKK